jgi:hypothetical protein
MYQSNHETVLSFHLECPDEQAAAQAFLQEHGLDRVARKQLESRWNVKWCTAWKVGKGDRRRRSLYQWYILSQYVAF